VPYKPGQGRILRPIGADTVGLTMPLVPMPFDSPLVTDSGVYRWTKPYRPQGKRGAVKQRMDLVVGGIPVHLNVYYDDDGVCWLRLAFEVSRCHDRTGVALCPLDLVHVYIRRMVQWLVNTRLVSIKCFHAKARLSVAVSSEGESILLMRDPWALRSSGVAS
jgi:hypothetical protein